MQLIPGFVARDLPNRSKKSKEKKHVIFLSKNRSILGLYAYYLLFVHKSNKYIFKKKKKKKKPGLAP